MQSVDRHAFVVLGMHRSGTSGVAGALARLGATAPLSMAPGAVDNPRGFWESLPIVALNDELLASLGSSWDDWSAIEPEAFDSPAVRPFAERARHLLATEFADAPLIVLKDPRICRLTPFWLRVLEQENLSPVFVIPLRSPLEVALSLRKRNGFPVSKGLLLWLRHVLDAESATRKLKRSFVEWEAFPGDWRSQAARMAREFGVELPHADADAGAEVDAFLDTRSKRQPAADVQVKVDSRLQETILATYASLRALARDPMDGAALAGLHQAKRLFDHSCALLGPAFSDLRAGAEQEKAEIDRRVTQLTVTPEQRRADADQRLAQMDAALEQERADTGRRVTQLTAVLEQERADAARRFAELNEALDRQRSESSRRIGELAGQLEQNRSVAQAREEELGSALQRERQRADDLQAELSSVSRQLETARQQSLAGRSRSLARFLRRLVGSE
jgi:hypothetical protein